MKNLITRTITGAVFTGAIILSAVFSPLAFAFVFLIMALVSHFEFQRLLIRQPSLKMALPGLFTAMACYLIIAAVPLNLLAPQYLVLVLPLLLVSGLYSYMTKQKKRVALIQTNLLGVVMLVFPLALLNFFLNPQLIPGYHTPWFVLGMFVILWTHDTFAYLTGSMFGRHPLSKTISPKKSWEGSIGGFGFAIIAAFVISIFSPEMNVWSWLAIALIVVFFGTLGDLAESLLKRRAGVKDSGTILPGHGGALDRFDSVFFVSPLVLILILLSIQ